VRQVPAEAVSAFAGVSLQNVKLVDAAFFVVPLLSRQIKTPLLPVGQNGNRNTAVEGILEQLAVTAFGLTYALHLKKNARPAAAVAESEVHALALQDVLGRHYLSVKDRPAEFLENRQNDTLRNGRLVPEAARPQVTSNPLDPFLAHCPFSNTFYWRSHEAALAFLTHD
jgi:hypothetical protein